MADDDAPGEGDEDQGQADGERADQNREGALHQEHPLEQRDFLHRAFQRNAYWLGAQLKVLFRLVRFSLSVYKHKILYAQLDC